MMDRESLLIELHNQFGICGICGSHTCNSRASYSDLPEQINTRKLLDIINKLDKQEGEKE